MDNELSNTPLSESNVSFKLADIQKRCSQMLQSDDGMLELTLEDYKVESDNDNPYDRG